MESSTKTDYPPRPAISYETLKRTATHLRGMEDEARTASIRAEGVEQAGDLARLSEALGQAEEALFRVVNVADSYLRLPGAAEVLDEWNPRKTDAKD